MLNGFESDIFYDTAGQNDFAASMLLETDNDCIIVLMITSH